MAKPVEKITTESRLVAGKQIVLVKVYHDLGHLPDFEKYMSWKEFIVFIEDCFYVRDNHLFYSPERG